MSFAPLTAILKSLNNGSGRAIAIIPWAIFLAGCQPNIDSADPEERISAVERISDGQLLVGMARDDVDATVRLAAVYRITDQMFLASVARRDMDVNVRLAAVMRLTDQQLLSDVAVAPHPIDIQSRKTGAPYRAYRAHAQVYEAIVEKLTDQTELARIAANGKSSDIRRSAIRKITDQDILLDLALSSSASIARSAVYYLEDKANLARVSMEVDDYGYAIAAIKKLKDQRTLAEIALHARSRLRPRSLRQPQCFGACHELQSRNRRRRQPCWPFLIVALFSPGGSNEASQL